MNGNLKKIRNFWNVETMHDAMFERVSKSKTLERSKACFSDDRVLSIIDEDISLYKEDLSNLKVLDFGCGVGRVLKKISERCKNSYGVDISQNMLDFAREYINDDSVTLSLCDNEKIYLESNFFDLIYSFHVLQHIPTEQDLTNSLSEIYRVQRPGGISVLHFSRKISEEDKQSGSFAGFRPTKTNAINMCENIGFSTKEVRFVENGSFILYLEKNKSA
jgi:ubiquinone/menaquinone biosynthesis C-methylase UbiE